MEQRHCRIPTPNAAAARALDLAATRDFPAFEHQRVIESRHARYLLGPLFERHRIQLPALPPGPVEFTWQTKLARGSLAPWVSLPNRYEPGYFLQMKRLAWAVQCALRIWMPYLYFQRLDNYADPISSWPMLVFAVMRPVESRTPAAFGYDILEPRRIGTSFYRAGRPLRHELHRLHEILPALGRRDLLEAFPSKNPDRMLRLMRAIPRYFGRLVRLEATVLREFMRLGELPQQDRIDAYPAIAAEVAREMKRSFRGFSFEPLAPLVMNTAVWALGRAQRNPMGLQSSIRFGPAGGQQEIFIEAPISYANSRSDKPLD